MTKTRFGIVLLSSLALCVNAQTESGFVSLFDGKSLTVGRARQKRRRLWSYQWRIYCAREEAETCSLRKSFRFHLRLQFKLEPDGNNGVGIRAPLEGDAAYNGMEIQVLDDKAPKHATIKPWQFNGSVYNVVPAKNGTAKIGEWNDYEITAKGRKIKVVLNGRTIVDTDLNDVHDPATIEKHPGIFRDRGHVGFLGHNDYVEFRNIRIKELPG